MTSPIARAREAAEELIAVLREHDLEGDALDTARRFARVMRRLERRQRALTPGLVDGVDDQLGGVEAACQAPALRFVYPVRRAVAELGRTWDETARAPAPTDSNGVRTRT